MDGTRRRALTARGLSLKGPRGWVYRDVDLTVRAGRLVTISGESGTGRTSLLLTLAGRMRPTAGSLRVAGRTRTRDIQRVAAVGAAEGVNELDDSLTVAEHVFELRHLRGALLPLLPKKRRREVAAVLAPLGLDLDPDALVQDLRPREQHLFGAALALMAEPAVLLLDNVDRGLSLEGQREVWERLRALEGVTVIATCVEPGPATGLADQGIGLP